MTPIKRILFPVFFLVLFLSAGLAIADPPQGYYDSIDVSSPATLHATLHALIDDHTVFPYSDSSTDTWDILELADENPANSAYILDVYKNASYLKFGGGSGAYNREHTWPSSIALDGSPGYTDCHHLFLCDPGYNSYRGSRGFRSCSAACTEKITIFNDGTGGGSGVYPGNSNWYTGSDQPPGTWEVWMGRRGDIARAMFYMEVRYDGDSGEPDLILTDNDLLIGTEVGDKAYFGVKSVLLQWHRDDPVDDKERNRNDVVYSFQGNRNPFIDYPEWLDVIVTPNQTQGWGSFKARFR
jgi:endonuclease I